MRNLLITLAIIGIGIFSLGSLGEMRQSQTTTLEPFLPEESGIQHIEPASQNAPTPVRATNKTEPTKPSSSGCSSSYAGACLREGIGDYDCAGGSGNGPNYTGKVQVVGPDIFGLDRDHDGWACE